MSPPTTICWPSTIPMRSPPRKPRRPATESPTTCLTRNPPSCGTLSASATAPVTSMRSSPYHRRLRSTSSFFTVFAVTTNPSPSLPPDLVMLWLTIPIKSPARLNIGPPELPVLMTASVWKNSASGKSLVTVSASHRALMIPALSEWARPYGAPTRKIGSPTRTESESVSFATTTSGGTDETWMMEMSARGSEAITRAGTGSSPMNSTMMSSIVCTTCAAVATFPSGVTKTPEPISRNREMPSAVTSWPRDRITITDGLTRRNTSPSVSPAARGGDVRRTASASIARRQLPRITTPPTRKLPGSLGPAVQQVERVHQRRHRCEGPKPSLVDGHDRARAVERGQRSIDLRLEGVVPAAHHERVRLVREDFATQPELRGVPGGGEEARQQEVVGGVGVEPTLLQTAQALTVVGNVDRLGLDGCGTERGREGLVGGRVGNYTHAFAGEILHPADPRADRGQEAPAVHEDHVAEGDLFHAAERDRGRSALEVDVALDELGHAIGRRHRHPGDLEVGELQELSDGGGHLQAQIHRVAGRLTVAAEEGERPRRLTMAELDGAGLLDLVEGRPDLLGQRRPGHGDQKQARHEPVSQHSGSRDTSGGRRSIHGRARSSCAARRNSVASSP